MFTILAIVVLVLGLLVIGIVIGIFNDRIRIEAILGVGLVVVLLGGWLVTHDQVPSQYVGVTKSVVSQRLEGPFQAGIISRPFFGSIYTYPASSNMERCEVFTPAIKGSYGITAEICFYVDASSIDWLAEVNKTGTFDANAIMGTWRNNVVGDVAKTVKPFTPEELNDKRDVVEADIFEKVNPWFAERGIVLNNVSFKNWDFTSPEVAAAFDTSIVSQRKITEQAALLEAAKIAREREVYEANTALFVAESQKRSLETLGLEGSDAVNYLWIKALSDGQKVPDVVILGAGGVPVTVPIK